MSEIYSRFGGPVPILADCGRHKPNGYACPLVLLKVRYEDCGDEGYAFADTLRASGGITAIDEAVAAAPEIKWNAEELQAALEQAE